MNLYNYIFQSPISFIAHVLIDTTIEEILMLYFHVCYVAYMQSINHREAEITAMIITSDKEVMFSVWFVCLLAVLWKYDWPDCQT